MSSQLDKVRDGRASVEAANSSLHSSIIAARDSGETLAAIAEAAGLSRQRIHQLVKAEAETEDRMRARLEELDARYEALVDKVALGEGRPGDYKVVTAIQNGYARKLARKGVVQPTVKQMLRGMAESKLLAVLEHRRDEPVIQAIVRDLDEAAVLRKRLTSLQDSRVFGETV